MDNSDSGQRRARARARSSDFNYRVPQRARRGFDRTLPSRFARRLMSPSTRFRGDSHGNFYILPAEVLYYLSYSGILDANDKISLDAFNNFVQQASLHSDSFVPFMDGARRARDVMAYVENEFMKMINGPVHLYHQAGPDIDFPYTEDTMSNPKLVIPTIDAIHDLPVYVMLYILYYIDFHAKPHQNYYISYEFSTDPGVWNIIKNLNNTNVVIQNRSLTLTALRNIYNALMHNFASVLDGDGVSVEWQGSEGSGTRIFIMNYAGDTIEILLKLLPGARQGMAGSWNEKVESLVTESIGRSVISVKNPDDNKCLIYCLILGLLVKLKGVDPRVFGANVIFIPDFEVFAKGSYLFLDDEPISNQLRLLGRLLFPATYSLDDANYPGEEKGLRDFVEVIDKSVGTMMSLDEFREKFEVIENTLLPDKMCGIDVYGMDNNINTHVYPLYISKNRKKVIELLCVTPAESESSHFCVIINKEKLFQLSGGKQFFTCSKCGKCYFHRKMLSSHECKAKENELFEEGGGYHFSQKDGIENCGIQPLWVCTKCRLCFVSEFKWQYHMDHCFMEGKTGFRHVQLVTYEKNAHPTLDGVEVSMEEEEAHVADRLILYADFECSIDPDTGVHSFMSYGLYNWDEDQYYSGDTLEKFVELLETIAFSAEQKHIYVYFHNAMNYDANFVLRYIMSQEKYKNWGIQVIMKSSNRLQKLVFYAVREQKRRRIHIADTFLFLTLSLERIVGSIRKDDMEMNKLNFDRFFEQFHRTYPDVGEEDIDHILRKNLFPYKFFTDSSKLLTPISEFLSIFEPKAENCKYFSDKVAIEDLEKNYPDVKHVCDVFECDSAKAYHDLYLMCDVMQLADVFNRSMNILWESHHIHLTRYLGMPSASWAAFLRFNPSMSIPLYEDTFYAEFFKGMIRGGITSASLRHAVADENHSIIYLDVNGLYPYVMQAYEFPCGEFRFEHFDVEGVEACNERLTTVFRHLKRVHKGMCFCVDLHIPDDVKEATDMYPFMPEHRRIFEEYYDDVETKTLTPFLNKWSEANEDEKMHEFTGLVCTLYDKEKYNVHYKTLQFYMDHGVQVTKIWFGVSFDEGNYLAGYIRKNIEIRNGRKDELGKTLYKLLGNSIYGKTFESPFKRNTYEIVRDPAKLQGLMDNSNISALTPIDDLGWVVKMEGEDIFLDKPTYIGACVCEFSKLHMYTLMYDKLVKMFPGTPEDPGCQMVYTDTDSFIVKLRHPIGVTDSETLFKYIEEKDPELIGPIGGQVKSETGKDTIQEVIALRSKVYAYITKEGHVGKRAKGTTGEAQELQLDFDTYKKTLETLVSVDTKNVQFLRETFKISSVDMFRRSLSVNDGKRYICDDGIHTHAFGYPGIKQSQNCFNEPSKDK